MIENINEHFELEEEDILSKADIIKILSGMEQEIIWDFADVCDAKSAEFMQWKNFFVASKSPERLGSLIDSLNEFQISELSNLVKAMKHLQEFGDAKKFLKAIEKYEPPTEEKKEKIDKLLELIEVKAKEVNIDDVKDSCFTLGKNLTILGTILHNYEKGKENKKWKEKLSEMTECDIDSLPKIMDIMIITSQTKV